MDSQLRKGVLGMVVLTLLAKQPSYGGELLERLAAKDLDVSEGTLYPLLSRVKKAGYVDTTWEPSPSGPPRKIYTVTTSGRNHLTDLTSQWQRFSASVSALVGKD